MVMVMVAQGFERGQAELEVLNWTSQSKFA
jgi:hypothetical protein